VLEYLCIMLPVAVLAVAHLLRVRCLKQQLQQSLEQRLEDRVKERTRIARELHDSLLQVSQGMMFRLEAVRRLLPNRPQEEAADHLAFIVRVRDEGIGLDPTVLKHGYRKGHWGLPGMRERVLEFGGKLAVWSRCNAGTEIELKIDARIAYVRRPKALRGRIAQQS
jgi:signal transduction histidine kinase